MKSRLLRRRGERRRPTRSYARPQVEPLEPRSLPSAAPGLALSFAGPTDPADTLESAAILGNLSRVPSIRVDAAIGDSPAGAADVDWYAFTLDRPATVTLAAVGSTGAVPPVLSLYVRDPFDPADPATLFGTRRLVQAAGTDPAAGTLLTRPLAAGSYYLAASGAGNSLFNPFVAGSGYDGQTGDYHLQLTAADLGLNPTDGPAVLASNPAPDSTLDRSPTVFRLDLSTSIDSTTVLPDDDVWLTYNPAGTFGDANDQDVPLNTVHFSDATSELQLTPAAPLAPGYYRLQLAGDTGANVDVVTGPDGTPLGTDALHPSGQDFALTFRVVGVEGNTGAGAGADDTPAGAHDLGDVSDGRLVQAAGAIGDDPTDPVPFDPADVDLYHFRLSGPGRYAFGAEVFAQRIGSPLNAAASLFVLGSDGHLHLIAGNDDTQNATQASDHKSLPLFADPAIFAGLTAGDYYLAVSSHKNVPDPNRNLLPGAGGIFDPEVSHSGRAGQNTGDYVLNLRVGLNDVPPRVVAVTPGPGAVLSAPPAHLAVQFDEPVNLQQLAFQAYQRTQQGSLASVYVRGPGGMLYYPRLQSFDPATGQATFLMLDRLPPGDYDLHLSGPLGLTDFAGNPLVGNDPGGDFVAHFTVGGTGVPAQSDQGPQELGVLFPHDLVSPGFTIPAGGAGSYRFEVLQAQNYFFLLQGASRPAGVRLTLTDDSGVAVAAKAQADGVSLAAFLKPGTYVLGVSGLAPADGSNSLRVVLGGSPENPQPLTLGPAPVLRLTLAPARPVPPAPPVTAPGIDVPPGAVQPPVTTTASPGPVEVPRVQISTGGAQPTTAPTTGAATGAPIESALRPVGRPGRRPRRRRRHGHGRRPCEAAAPLPGRSGRGRRTRPGARRAERRRESLRRPSRAQDAVAPASLPAGTRAATRVATADAVRLMGFRPWLEIFSDEIRVMGWESGEDSNVPEEILPLKDDRAADPEPDHAGPEVGPWLAALTGAALGLAWGRGRREGES